MKTTLRILALSLAVLGMVAVYDWLFLQGIVEPILLSAHLPLQQVPQEKLSRTERQLRQLPAQKSRTHRSFLPGQQFFHISGFQHLSL